MGFPGGSDSKESTCNEGDTGSIPGSPGERNGNPLLGNPMDRGTWQATVHAQQGCLVFSSLFQPQRCRYRVGKNTI